MENVMQPYEIRQFRDGSIDYSNYYARPVSLLAPNLRRFNWNAVSPKVWLLMAATIAALTIIPVLMGNRAAANPRIVAPEGTKVNEQQVAAFRSVQDLHDRISVLANSDALRWGEGYGKSTGRSQAAAIEELQRQLAETKVAIKAW